MVQGTGKSPNLFLCRHIKATKPARKDGVESPNTGQPHVFPFPAAPSAEVAAGEVCVRSQRLHPLNPQRRRHTEDQTKPHRSQPGRRGASWRFVSRTSTLLPRHLSSPLPPLEGGRLSACSCFKTRHLPEDCLKRGLGRGAAGTLSHPRPTQRDFFSPLC